MNNRGQSIIEYTIIVILVILGIVMMGPYALRSVGAHFKLWDYSVHDSYSESLAQAPVNDVPDISTNCACQDNVPMPPDCGSSLAGSLCGPNQNIVTHTCNIQGCDGEPATKCVLDTDCCNLWTNIRCGRTPIGQNPPANDCNYNFEVQGHQCGSNTAIQCVPDAAHCAPTCLGNVFTLDGVASIPCPNEPPQSGSLDQTYGITYVSDKAQCDPKQNCQYISPPTCVSIGNPYPAYNATLAQASGSGNGETLWDAFMQNYAMWVGPPPDSSYINCTGTIATIAPDPNPYNFSSANATPIYSTYTRGINIAAANSYTIHLEADNWANVYIDVANIDATNPPPPVACHYDTTAGGNSICTFQLTAGFHTVIIKAANATGSPGDWHQNPAGVAMQMFLGTTTVSPSTPFIDTGPTQINSWVAQVECDPSTNTIWNCTSFSCVDANSYSPCICSPNDIYQGSCGYGFYDPQGCPQGQYLQIKPN